MLEFNQGDVNYIVGQCAISEQVLSHPKSQNLQNQRRLAVRDITRVFFNAPYLGKEPTTSWRYEIEKLVWGCSQWQ